MRKTTYIFEFSVKSSIKCSILRRPVGEGIMDAVPRGTELELQLRWGVGQVAHICNNLDVMSTDVY